MLSFRNIISMHIFSFLDWLDFVSAISIKCNGWHERKDESHIMSIYRMKLNYLFDTSHACWRPDIEPVYGMYAGFHAFDVRPGLHIFTIMRGALCLLEMPIHFRPVYCVICSLSLVVCVCVCAPNKILQIKLAIVHISRTHFYQSIEMTKIAWYLASNRSCSIFYHLNIAQKHLFTRIIMLTIHTHTRVYILKKYPAATRWRFSSLSFSKLMMFFYTLTNSLSLSISFFVSDRIRSLFGFQGKKKTNLP